LREEVTASPFEDLHSSLQNILQNQPKILLISSHGAEFSAEIEDFFSTPVFFVDRFSTYDFK
jgi:hypothetical protein